MVWGLTPSWSDWDFLSLNIMEKGLQQNWLPSTAGKEMHMRVSPLTHVAIALSPGAKPGQPTGREASFQCVPPFLPVHRV